MSLALSFVLVLLRFPSEAWPRAGLGEPRSASNANKPASSWPLKQGRKKCSKHGCDRETSTVRWLCTALELGISFCWFVFGPGLGWLPLLFTPLCLLSFAVDSLLGDSVQSIHSSSSLCPSSLGDPVQSFSFISPLCGKFKPKLVQKSFLRKSQDLHLDAVPTTYAQRSLRKRGSHTQALRFGAAQPFWTLSQRCCSNKNTRTKATSKTSKMD